MANDTTLQEIINDQQPMSAPKVLDNLAVNTHRHSQWTQSEHDDGLAKELRAARKEAELYKYQRGVVGQRLEEIMVCLLASPPLSTHLLTLVPGRLARCRSLLPSQDETLREQPTAEAC